MPKSLFVIELLAYMSKNMVKVIDKTLKPRVVDSYDFCIREYVIEL